MINYSYLINPAPCTKWSNISHLLKEADLENLSQPKSILNAYGEKLIPKVNM